MVKGPVGAALHFEHGGAGSYLEVRGSDTAITMDREASSTIWTDVTDSDAVSILSSYGLVPDVDSTSAGHYETKHVMVQRESDLSFVRRLARRNGFIFWVTCDPSGIETAHFRKPPVDAPPAMTLKINDTPPTSTLSTPLGRRAPVQRRGQAARPQHARGPRRRIADAAAGRAR